jgi:proteasome lid subunit RPN8/RPN11
MLEEIKSHFDEHYPKEACGVIGVVQGKKKWFPCKNVAEDDEDFILCSEDWFRVRQQADIIAIVHNHPDYSNEPSENDINYCNALGIPYWIFSYPEMDLNIVNPTALVNPLIGREYSFGVQDCFEAMRDWLLSEGIEIPKRAAFEDDWWLKGLNYFTEETISLWGFKKVTEPQKNDLLIFQVSAEVPNHCGVYLGNDIFFHHAVNRLSCRESLYPFWIRNLVGIYRHAS